MTDREWLIWYRNWLCAVHNITLQVPARTIIQAIDNQLGVEGRREADGRLESVGRVVPRGTIQDGIVHHGKVSDLTTSATPRASTTRDASQHTVLANDWDVKYTEAFERISPLLVNVTSRPIFRDTTEIPPGHCARWIENQGWVVSPYTDWPVVDRRVAEERAAAHQKRIDNRKYLTSSYGWCLPDYPKPIEELGFNILEEPL